MSTEKLPSLHPLQKTQLVIGIIATIIGIIAAILSAVVWVVTKEVERDKLRIETDKLVIERDKLKTDRGRLDLEYVRLAIGILQPTEKIEEPQKELRGWAVEILQDSSPRIKLSTVAAEALKNGDANLSDYWSTPYYNENATFTSEHYPAPRRNDNLKPPKPAPTPLPKAQQ